MRWGRSGDSNRHEGVGARQPLGRDGERGPRREGGLREGGGDARCAGGAGSSALVTLCFLRGGPEAAASRRGGFVKGSSQVSLSWKLDLKALPGWLLCRDDRSS